MKRTLLLAVALAVGGCGLFGGSGGSTTRSKPPERTTKDPEPAPPPPTEITDGDEEVYQGLTRWREGLLKGDFEAFHDSHTYYGRAQWLRVVLDREFAKSGGVPRAGELSEEKVQEISAWRAEQNRQLQAGRAMQEMPGEFVRHPWTRNVLKDDFARTHQDLATKVASWVFKHQGNNAVGTEAWLLVSRPGQTDAIFYMVRQEKQWRHDRLIAPSVR